MNSHLSSEEMYQWLSGEHGADVDEHFRECPACRTELLQLRSALAGFRTSLEESPVPAVSRKQSSQRLSRWVLASAALSLMVAAPVFLFRPSIVASRPPGVHTTVSPSINGDSA